MGIEMLLGCGMMIICMAIQCVTVSLLLHGLRTLEEKHLIRSSIIPASGLLIAVLLVLLAGNLFQASLWAAMFFASGEFKEFSTAFYHSLVNFTTLGYGDLVMSTKRRILGVLEAANGVLMLGLTTSVLYSTISALMHRSQHKRKDKHATPDHPIANKEEFYGGTHGEGV